MKKLLPLFFILFIIGFSLRAQNSGLTLPTPVSETFKESFPNAKYSVWNKEGEFYTVKFFVQNNQSVHIVYNEKGQVVEKYMALPTKDTPAVISTYLKENYPDHEVQHYWIKQKGGERIYKVELVSLYEGKGAIIGVSSGKSTADVDLKEKVPTLDNKRESNQIIYFDKNGSILTSTEAVEGMDPIEVVEVERDISTKMINKRKRN